MEQNDLKNTLKTLKLYRDLTKKIGKRGKIIFDKIIYNKDYYLVEYYPSVSEDFAYDKSLEVYNKVFSCKPSRSEVVFLQKHSILGGLKVYKNDDVVDLSFSKLENILKK